MLIKPADLKPGDVLLYHGTALVSRLIRLFDGTEYSHASIWVGDHVVEALGNGVNARGLKVSTADAKYTDVYRYRNKDSGLMLGDDNSPLPAKPVLDQAKQFETDKDRYAYEEILLLALLASTRQLTTPVPLLGFILRNFLDHAADLLARLIHEKKEPLICSELVYRCFSQAGQNYKIRIHGADMAMATMAAAVPPLVPAQDLSGYQSAAASFLANYQAAKAVNTGPRPLATAPAAAAMAAAVANFVTPGDLKKSPDLQLLGTLQL